MTDAVRFEEIYREYRPKVLDYIRSHVNSPEDAEDLCSEVFRKVLEHLDPAAGNAVSSYIYTITSRTVVDYYRTRRIQPALDEEIPDPDSMEEALLSRETLEQLAAALRELPERERDIIVLHYSAGEPLREISRKMDLPYGVVKRAHMSALRNLRRALAPLAGEGE